MLRIGTIDPIGDEELHPSVRRISRRGAGFAAFLAILAADAVLFHISLPYLLQGVLDEISHVLTALLLLLALPWRPSRRFMLAMLAASVLIDLDHIPIVVGYDPLIPVSGRPYTHSFLAIAVIVAAVMVLRRHDRDLILGIGCGLAAHLARDLFTGDVPLLWPLTSHQLSLPYAWYLLALTALLVLVIRRPPTVWSVPFTQ